MFSYRAFPKPNSDTPARRRGAALVEFVFVIPVLVLIGNGMFQSLRSVSHFPWLHQSASQVGLLAATTLEAEWAPATAGTVKPGTTVYNNATKMISLNIRSLDDSKLLKLYPEDGLDVVDVTYRDVVVVVGGDQLPSGLSAAYMTMTDTFNVSSKYTFPYLYSVTVADDVASTSGYSSPDAPRNCEFVASGAVSECDEGVTTGLPQCGESGTSPCSFGTP